MKVIKEIKDKGIYFEFEVTEEYYNKYLKNDTRYFLSSEERAKKPKSVPEQIKEVSTEDE